MQLGAGVLQNLVHVLHPGRKVTTVDIRLVKLQQISILLHIFSNISLSCPFVSFDLLSQLVQHHTSISGSGPELPESAAASSASAIVILLLIAGRLSKCLS